nr:C4-dicarboxylic acid transporter DauA [Kofleriaceae bacterium]
MLRRSLRYVDELSDAVKRRLSAALSARELLGYGLRDKLREGYTRADFRADLLASLVVGVVALPLSMALAIAVGMSPESGLYTAIIAGVTCALLGGTRFQVTGPTAAFVVVLVPIVQKFGPGGLFLAGAMAGVILLILGLARLGKLMEFVPHPVTSGFTMGIAVVIGALQLKDALGVTGLPSTDNTPDYLAALWAARAAIQPWDAGIAAVTVGLLLAIPRATTRVPAPLLALTAVAVGVAVLAHYAPDSWDFHAATIGSRFHYVVGGEQMPGVPPLPPHPIVPWAASDAAHPSGLHLDWHTLRELLPAAFAIAMLGAIESLLAAVVADGMAGTRHDPNSELIALGIANIVVPFFGGIAATGALARTATNIRAGARSPLSAAMHALFVLACTIALAPLVSYLPMAALAGLLIVVARNMSEARHFVRLVRIAPRHDVLVMLTCFGLTVAFDMVVSVTVGVLLAALLFMRRMAVLTTVAEPVDEQLAADVPAGVRLYRIAGPMFFGAAKSAMEQLAIVGDRHHTYILDMRAVPTMDATGLVALESVLDRLRRSKIKVIFAGLSPEVSDVLERAGIRREPGRIAYAPDIETAVSMSIIHTARLPTPHPA